MYEEAKFLAGAAYVDDRGILAGCNEFQFASVRRAYFISSSMPQLPRAWHGHRSEHKYLWPVRGAFVVQVVQPNDWANPLKTLPVSRFVISSTNPGVLHIPAGFAHGFMALGPDTVLAVFSTATLEESAEDDYRFPYDLWGVDGWTIRPR